MRCSIESRLERRDSARRALAAQERERARIARELHDEVGQALTAVLWMVDGDAREAVRGALEDVRAIARRLRPEALDDLGLLPALAALTVAVQRNGHVRVERDLDATPRRPWHLRRSSSSTASPRRRSRTSSGTRERGERRCGSPALPTASCSRSATTGAGSKPPMEAMAPVYVGCESAQC